MYRPFAAVQVPRLTGPVVAPAPIVPVNEPVSVRTAAPASLSTVSVMPCAPLAEATVPWLRIATVNVTVAPPDGLFGDQLTDPATRSELATGVTTSEVGVGERVVGLVQLDHRVVLVDLGRHRVRAGVAGADVGRDRGVAPAASPPTAAVPTWRVPR